MSDNHIPYLCGGTFFTLLERVKEKKKTKQEIHDGEVTGTANKHILGGLIQLLDTGFTVPSKKCTYDTEVSDYKKLFINKGNGIQADTINGNITLNIGRKDGK